MATILPFVYVGVPCIVLGAVFGALWGRKHPKLIEGAVQIAQQAKGK